MKFWPLVLGILATGYYAAWKDYWWFPLGAIAGMGLLLWHLGFGALGIAVGVAATAAVSPLLFAIGVLVFIRLR